MPDKRLSPRPLCIIIAGPNGAGKTTFAREFLEKEANVIHFVNADLIAQGLSPLRPEFATRSAARLFLRTLDQMVADRANFAFETTLSGLTYIRLLKQWKASGYRIQIIFFQLHSPSLALRRIASRVRQGGHNVPPSDVLRRFERGLHNFNTKYRSLADAWTIYDNSGDAPVLLDQSQ